MSAYAASNSCIHGIVLLCSECDRVAPAEFPLGRRPFGIRRFVSWSTSIPLLGNHLSLFCLLFSVTTIINQLVMMKQQNMGVNPQMATMKWMMYIMPVMFFFIFNEYASGLSYYYFVSSLIGILTTWVMYKVTDEKKTSCTA